MQMHFHRKLPIPQEVKKEFPLTERMKQVKDARDESIRAVFDGSLDKFILVIGPCSADHSEPVLEYISRLRRNCKHCPIFLRRHPLIFFKHFLIVFVMLLFYLNLYLIWQNLC